MKFAQLAIGSILFIEAVLLLYSPQQRYNFHSFIEFVKDQANCQCFQTLCFKCLQKLRFFAVALMISGAYSLTLGSNVFVGLLAQLVWTVTQSELYYGCGLMQVRNTLVQVLFIIILLGEWRNEWRQCKKRRQQLKKKHEDQVAKIAAQQKAQALKQNQSEPEKKESKKGDKNKDKKPSK